MELKVIYVRYISLLRQNDNLNVSSLVSPFLGGTTQIAEKSCVQ